MSNDSGHSNLRKANASDLAEILDIFKWSIESTCRNDYNEEQIKSWTSGINNRNKWLNRINNDYFIVAEKNGQISGFASMQRAEHIDLLYVHPNHQRKNIAKELMDNMLAKALDNNSLYLKADVSITARPFFEAMNFNTIRTNRVRIHGTEFINYSMELTLI